MYDLMLDLWNFMRVRKKFSACSYHGIVITAWSAHCVNTRLGCCAFYIHAILTTSHEDKYI